jgi:hypothetical protein
VRRKEEEEDVVAAVDQDQAALVALDPTDLGLDHRTWIAMSLIRSRLHRHLLFLARVNPARPLHRHAVANDAVIPDVTIDSKIDGIIEA